jgi:hypothetical protein
VLDGGLAIGGVVDVPVKKNKNEILPHNQILINANRKKSTARINTFNSPLAAHVWEYTHERQRCGVLLTIHFVRVVLLQIDGRHKGRVVTVQSEEVRGELHLFLFHQGHSVVAIPGHGGQEVVPCERLLE